MTKIDVKMVGDFWGRVDKGSNGCWLWTGRKNQFGYGLVSLGQGRYESAHRFSMRLEQDEGVPRDLQVDHKCHNTLCVNPEHLQIVTGFENQQNRKGANQKNPSGVRGVSWSRKRGKYEVKAQKDGVTYHGGRFVSIQDAEQAAIRLRMSLYTNNLRDRERVNG